MTTVMTKTTTKGRSPRFLTQADILRNDRLSMKKVNFEPKPCAADISPQFSAWKTMIVTVRKAREEAAKMKASKDEAAAKEIASRQQDMVAERRAVAFEMIGNVKGVWRERQMSIVMVVEKKVFFAELRSAVENRSTTRVFIALTRLETERPSMYVREATSAIAERSIGWVKCLQAPSMWLRSLAAVTRNMRLAKPVTKNGPRI